MASKAKTKPKISLVKKPTMRSLERDLQTLSKALATFQASNLGKIVAAANVSARMLHDLARVKKTEEKKLVLRLLREFLNQTYNDMSDDPEIRRIFAPIWSKAQALVA